MEGESVMIRVLCRDKSRGFVQDSDFDDLVRRGIVVAFYRPSSDEWVDAKGPDVRQKSEVEYYGPERRIYGKIDITSKRDRERRF